MPKIWDVWKNTKIIYPTRKHLKLDELDKIPYYDENDNIIDNKKNEREEQYIGNDYIMPDMVVLELGARYGTVSCVINNKLENPLNHVVIEPDTTVIDALKSNKSMKLNKKGYASSVELLKNEDIDDENIVKNYSLTKIMKKYDLNFDTLVADCEGCLCSFIKENEKYIKNYKLIIFERDMPNNCNYTTIDKQLKKWNFKQIIEGFVCVWKK